MNKQEYFYEDNLARLVRASFDNSTRPDARSHQRGWENIKSIWTAEHAVAQNQATNQTACNPVAKHNKERNTFMNRLFKKQWGLGLGALGAASTAAIIIAAFYPQATSKAATVMANGARAVANLASIHLRGQLRTASADNFSCINADSDSHPVEFWKEFSPALKWRAEKPGRVAVMDGAATVLYIKTENTAMKFPATSSSAFDTGWLHQIADMSGNLERELRLARANGWKMDFAGTTGADGKPKSVVTIHAKSTIPKGEYGRDSFLFTTDTRRVYLFDAQSERLESIQIFQVFADHETLIFELTQIDYNQAIDPAVWKLDLPDDVIWRQAPQKLPDNKKYEAIPPEAAARAFFEACARKDWDEAGKFMPFRVPGKFKEKFGGMEIVSMGEPFTTTGYPGVFVPYEIRLQSGESIKRNLAIRKDNPAKRWQFDGGL